MNPHESELETLLSGGGSVCPFAAGSKRIYISDADSPKAMRAAVARFAAPRGKRPYGALLVLGSTSDASYDTFEAVQFWAREVFLSLAYNFARLGGASLSEAYTYVQSTMRPMLLDDTDPRRPVLGCGDQPLFCFCIAPLYPKTHPRYAPQPVVVVTWQADVFASMTSQAVVDSIRGAMKREHGSVYDADELMLPLPGHR